MIDNGYHTIVVGVHRITNTAVADFADLLPELEYTTHGYYGSWQLVDLSTKAYKAALARATAFAALYNLQGAYHKQSAEADKLLRILNTLFNFVDDRLPKDDFDEEILLDVEKHQQLLQEDK